MINFYLKNGLVISIKFYDWVKDSFKIPFNMINKGIYNNKYLIL